MKICMVGFGIGKTHGAFVGGHVNNVINLSKALANEGHEIDIISTPPIHSDNTPGTYQVADNITIHTVNLQKKLDSTKISEKGRLSIVYGVKSYYKIISTIKKLHKLKKFDVIHGHSGLPWVASIPEYVRIIEGIPVTHTLYCPLENVHKVPSKLCFSRVDSVIALSQNVKSSLEGVVLENKIRNIPPLIDISRFTPKYKENSQVPINLLYLGNLSRAKGIVTLINALKIIKKDYTDIKLVLCLDIPVDEYHKRDLNIKNQIKEMELEENIVPLGIVENLPDLMSQSDIFVAPFQNTQEPADYPLSILEAMACELPVVSTNVGGIPEIVKDNEFGLLVEPENPVELANKIIYLLKNDAIRIKMGQKGSVFVRNLNEDIIKETLKNYMEICDK